MELGKIEKSSNQINEAIQILQVEYERQKKVSKVDGSDAVIAVEDLDVE